MALESVLSGTPAQIQGVLERIADNTAESGRPNPWIWTGWLQLWGITLTSPVLELDLQHILGYAPAAGEVRLPATLPGLIPASVRVATKGPQGMTEPWYLSAGAMFDWRWPVDRLWVYSGAADLAWPAPTYLTIRAWRR